jgi:SAM-dependent methyltransferase
MTGSGYVFDQGWRDERARLAGIEALWDSGTQTLLADCGALAGARVLEAGAGGGSIVTWLADQVGATGHVLAVDRDVRFVEPLRSATVDVRQGDLVAGDLPEAEFDLVHTRLVLEHIPERDRVLDHLVRTLRPGGALVVEDYDWTAFGFDSADGSEQRATEGILELMAAAGFDRTYGRTIVGALADRGLADVHGGGRSIVIDDTHPGFAFFRLSFEQLAPAAVDAGLMTVEDASVVGERLRKGGVRIITPTLVSAIGRAHSSPPAGRAYRMTP